jgi:GLPGLI family protein
MATYKLEFDFKDLDLPNAVSKVLVSQMKITEIHEVWYNTNLKFIIRSPHDFLDNDYYYTFRGEKKVHDSRRYNEGRFEYLRTIEDKLFQRLTGKVKMINNWKCYELNYKDKGRVETAWGTTDLPIESGWVNIKGINMAIVEIMDEQVDVKIVKNQIKKISEVEKIIDARSSITAFDMATIKYLDSNSARQEIKGYLNKYKMVYQFFWDGELSSFKDQESSWYKSQIKEHIFYLKNLAKQHPQIIIQLINISDEDYFVLSPHVTAHRNIVERRGGSKLFKQLNLKTTPMLVSINRANARLSKVIHQNSDIDKMFMSIK